MKTLSLSSNFKSLPLSRIDERYGRFRLIHPGTDKAMVTSMTRYGQLTPAIVGPAESGSYPLIDGFKRLRACRSLGLSDLKVEILNTAERAAKAAIFHLNRKSRSMTQLEEGLIIRSFCREDSLTQVEISVLLGCHKSFVCRRLAMVERLAPEVLEEVRLGLVGIGLSRELTRLPCGNQAAVLTSVREHQLTCKETARLVKALKETPKSNHADILKSPKSLGVRHSSVPRSKVQQRDLLKELQAIKKQFSTLIRRLKAHPVVLSANEHSILNQDVCEIMTDLEKLKQLPNPVEVSHAVHQKS